MVAYREDRATVEAERDRMAALGARVLSLDAEAVRERFPALSTCGEPFDSGASACQRANAISG